jgi:histidinol-phosphate phosphatase family protein
MRVCIAVVAMAKPAVFLDRDGVINRYPGDTKYVTCWKEFKFLPNVKKAVALLNTKHYPVFVVSNQAGVSKGTYTQDTLNAITKKMLNAFKKSNAKIKAVYYCIHRNEDNCSCRKPKTGLLKLALKGNSILLKRSFFIGDTIRDVNTAKATGCKSILVLSGKEKLSNRNNWQTQPDFIFKDLYGAAEFITGRDAPR